MKTTVILLGGFCLCLTVCFAQLRVTQFDRSGTLRWTNATPSTIYRVERASAVEGPYSVVTNVLSSGFTNSIQLRSLDLGSAAGFFRVVSLDVSSSEVALPDATLSNSGTNKPPVVCFTVSGRLGGVIQTNPRTYTAVTVYSGAAEFTFDATCSYDPDGDPLRFVWLVSKPDDGDADNGFANSPIAYLRTETPPRRYVTLRVYDGVGHSDFEVALHIVYPEEYIRSIPCIIESQVTWPGLRARLLTSIGSAARSLEEGSPEAALTTLREFKQLLLRKQPKMDASTFEDLMQRTKVLITSLKLYFAQWH